MRRLISIVFATLIVAFTIHTINHVNKSNQQIRLKSIQLKNTQVELDKLENDYELLNTDKTKTEQEKQQKIDELEAERIRLEKALEARRLLKEQEAKAYAAERAKPAVQAVSASSGGSGSCQAEIAKYSWNQSTALAVAKAESGLRTNAVNNNPATKDYSIGCFQINIYGANARTRPSEAQLKNASVNVAFAFRLYSGNGNSFIGQWGVCRNMACY